MSDESQDLSDDGWDGDDEEELDGEDGEESTDAEAGEASESSAGDADRGDDRGRQRGRGRREDLPPPDERSRLALEFVSDVIQEMEMDCRVRLRRPREGNAEDEISIE
ncbi:MAG TPA: hypothetical protein VM686_11025, partial [Polyangiaceae bacterium]|nr:hypothetical protein [Polyangiaceae bacterium]